MIWKIKENIFVGDYNSVEEGTLTENKITAILNVAFEINDPIKGYVEVRQVKVGMGDSTDNNPYMKELSVHVLKAMLYNGETVLVHCAAGLSRSVYVVVRALAEIEGKSYQEKYDEIRQTHYAAMYGPLFANL